METLLTILYGSIGGTFGFILVWVLRGWLTEKIKQSINHEYSQKLETHKAELNSKIQTIQNEYKIYQLRTSLFFDHQRAAFAQLLSKIAEANKIWGVEGFDYSEEQLTESVPHNQLEELRELYYKHQLFLDNECLIAMDLILESYLESYSENNRPPDPIDVEIAYDCTNYLQPLIASLFQQKIGVSNDLRALRKIALLGGIRILNKYHFSEIDLPIKGALEIKMNDHAADAVLKAEENYDKLIQKLYQFGEYLRSDGGFFYDAQMKILRYIEILNSAQLKLKA